jgi:competence protein ComEC
MPATKAHLWHYAPFIRLLFPLMAGIYVQWCLPFSLLFLLLSCTFLFVAVILYFFLPDKRKFQFNSINGLLINLLLFFTGACLAWEKDIRHNKDWIGQTNQKADYLVVTLLEPLVEKQNSFKALAEVDFISIGKKKQEANGKIIVYFKKDSLITNLDYGSQIVFTKPLQEIKNSGNPGSFNYRQYCLQQGISHQVYLTDEELALLPEKNKTFVPNFLFETRDEVINILRKFIPGEKEQGLAEALLIGYKDDLDKNLVQSYSNTGVVHIIAISGLHLGLIYWLLLILTKPIRNKKNMAWLRFLIIVAALWIFSLLAGAGPSVLRSAVMFTCIAFGEVLNKKSSIYNTLALSAFLLLVWNPFWLWDVGFQLSYTAVLSIVIFFKPIYNWFYIENKAIDWFWKLNALTLAAQILTLPISIYHFHQFPVLFIFANLLAVPLSSLIVIGEILLITCSFITPIATLLGWLLQQMILFMNFYIERLNSVSFAVWNSLSISIFQTIFLLGFVCSIVFWFIEKYIKAIWPALICLSSFFALRSLSFIDAYKQKELIVYNVPRHQAIDIIDGRKYLFLGDADLQKDDFIRNFHLQPSRILHRVTPIETAPKTIKNLEILNQKLILIDSAVSFKRRDQKIMANLIVLSKNPKLYISHLNDVFTIRQIVIDGSVPAWKAKLWKKDCDSLHVPCHDVSEKGAFVMKLQ